jgi:hypothetical protein
MRRFSLFGILAVFLVLTGCDSFVQEVNEPRDAAPAEDFRTPEDINFLATGVQAQFSEATAEIVPIADLLSDQFRFGRNNNDATFPTFRNLDKGAPQLQSNSVDDALIALGEYRRLADDLIGPAANADYGEDPPITQNGALFTANLHGGIARYYFATYFGLNPREGGGVIDQSEFIPAPAMYDSARTKFTRARELVEEGSRNAKILNSVEARSALYAGTQFGANTGGYSDALQRAAELAANGLTPEDEAFTIPYTQQQINGWFFVAGPGRVQASAQDGNIAEEIGDAYKDPSSLRSFPEILQNNSAESARVPLTGVTADVELVEFDAEGAVDVIQAKYPERSSNQDFISWEENHLIRAELEVRGYDTGDESALQLVNEVRGSFGLSALSTLGSGTADQLSTIAQERDRTLFATGQRLPDQRRLDAVDWHLQETVEGTTTWQYLPITTQERDNNPNL